MSAEKLAKVCGLLASDFPGERANAAAMATAMLVDMGMTWADLVGRAFQEKPAKVKREPRKRRERSTTPAPFTPQPEMVDFLTKYADDLTDWERKFLISLGIARRHLSERQLEVLWRIGCKCGETPDAMERIFAGEVRQAA
jgi:hypothetical protein